MLEFAKQTKNILAFCHLSTTYVNSNMSYNSIIEEEIYNKTQPVERMVSQYLKMNPIQIQESINSILEGYPDTYSLTKALVERSMYKQRGTLPMCIVRPSMILGSLKDPEPGWTDTANSVAAPMVFTGLGFYRYMLGSDGKNMLDICAVD